jgi:hypothetical protein
MFIVQPFEITYWDRIATLLYARNPNPVSSWHSLIANSTRPMTHSARTRALPTIPHFCSSNRVPITIPTRSRKPCLARPHRQASWGVLPSSTQSNFKAICNTPLPSRIGFGPCRPCRIGLAHVDDSWIRQAFAHFLLASR